MKPSRGDVCLAAVIAGTMLGFLYQKGTNSADDGGVCFYREALREADEKQYYNDLVVGGRGRVQGRGRGDWSIFLIGTGVGASIALTLLKLGGCGRRGLFTSSIALAKLESRGYVVPLLGAGLGGCGMAIGRTDPLSMWAGLGVGMSSARYSLAGYFVGLLMSSTVHENFPACGEARVSRGAKLGQRGGKNAASRSDSLLCDFRRT